ncbi:MAG: NAD(P)H-dependent oxidoreductase [Desulforegulaceae bacterium]|nr:NAD(P)H-dependent oxidoreductase [Desulforegulaceae bacterium]
MKITVLSGSPKGKQSVSLQSLLYLFKKNKNHEYNIFHISKSIKKIESNLEEFEKITNDIVSSDMVIFVTPVYTFIIPSQLKRFIELIFERKKEDIFKGKFAGAITTSINFFDNCAHNYLRSICDDFEMKFCGSFSADSYDLLDDLGREKLFKFGKVLFNNAKNNMPLQRLFTKSESTPKPYSPKKSFEKVEIKDKNLLIIKDKSYEGTNLHQMINSFKECLSSEFEEITLSDLNIKGGCTGCVQCGFDHQCIYEGVDDFIDFFNDKVSKADIIIMAGEIKDRWLSAKWKEFFDRSFFQNHVPTMMGKQVGMIISGNLSQHFNLTEVMEGFIQWQRANLCDIVTDEFVESIDENIQNLAKRIKLEAELDYIAPQGFPGKGGHKIFRDDIWGRHRFVFQTDHKWYEENDFYDFPQYDEKAIEMNENMLKLTSDPKMREAIRKMLRTEMVKPHVKIVEES